MDEHTRHEPIALKSISHYLTFTKKFFLWIEGEPAANRIYTDTQGWARDVKARYRDAYLPRPRRDRDETFVALET